MAIGIIIVILVVIALVVIGFLSFFVGVYNSLFRLRNDINKAWANIDVILKQRYDELPKLINSVKGYMKHESGLLTELTKARTAFLNAKTMSQKASADNMISGALKSIFAVAENYPNLKANENFIQLQSRISGLENELSDRREFYNDAANTFNIRIQSFPDMIIAGMLGYRQPIEMFKVTEQEKTDVKVEF